MSIADLIAQMRAAGASLDVIEIAVRSLETAMESERARDAERRAKQAARVRKHRETHRKGVTVTLPSRDGNLPPSSPPDGPPPPPAPPPPPLNPPRQPRFRA
ncbi:hypothetical protein BGCPKDLD_5295 [Methylorubrum suomiense]|uniref:Translation initiation factor IF-2 n=1 Tax=Methylorubrum suomiense TaxID=144191 RepID=A0ABQ4V384_9HYPH|nr:hypothetical protein BGCPKDLD_5295 [Methylorubrum suomiense]